MYCLTWWWFVNHWLLLFAHKADWTAFNFHYGYRKDGNWDGIYCRLLIAVSAFIRDYFLDYFPFNSKCNNLFLIVNPMHLNNLWSDQGESKNHHMAPSQSAADSVLGSNLQLYHMWQATLDYMLPPVDSCRHLENTYCSGSKERTWLITQKQKMGFLFIQQSLVLLTESLLDF